MRKLLRRWQRSPIAQGIGSNVAGQLAQSFAQLALVPVFVGHWGVAVYGGWLLLFTLPSYIAMADLGLGTAAGNEMTASVARGDRASAAIMYASVRAATLLTGGGVVLAVATLLYVLRPTLLDGLGHALGSDPRRIACILTLYGVVALQTGVINQGLRAIGGYAVAGYAFAALVLAEAVGALTMLANGCRPEAVAIWYLGARATMTALLGLGLARRAPWLTTMRWRWSPATLRRLLRPAAAVMAIPAAQAVSIQGTVVVIGAVLGSAAVPTFTAVRTLSRVAAQAVLIVNHAVMPSMTMADAVADRSRTARYARLSFAVSLGLAVPGALLLLFFGRWLVARWTSGALQPNVDLLAVMAATMVLNALWVPASNLILAINRHEGFSWLYLLLSLGALALCVPLTAWLGPAGAALSVLLVDAAMVARIAALSRRLALYAWRRLDPTLLAWRRRQR